MITHAILTHSIFSLPLLFFFYFQVPQQWLISFRDFFLFFKAKMKCFIIVVCNYGRPKCWMKCANGRIGAINIQDLVKRVGRMHC